MKPTRPAVGVSCDPEAKKETEPKEGRCHSREGWLMDGEDATEFILFLFMLVLYKILKTQRGWSTRGAPCQSRCLPHETHSFFGLAVGE